MGSQKLKAFKLPKEINCEWVIVSLFCVKERKLVKIRRLMVLSIFLFGNDERKKKALVKGRKQFFHPSRRASHEHHHGWKFAERAGWFIGEMRSYRCRRRSLQRNKQKQRKDSWETLRLAKFLAFIAWFTPNRAAINYRIVFNWLVVSFAKSKNNSSKISLAIWSRVFSFSRRLRPRNPIGYTVDTLNFIRRHLNQFRSDFAVSLISITLAVATVLFSFHASKAPDWSRIFYMNTYKLRKYREKRGKFLSRCMTLFERTNGAVLISQRRLFAWNIKISICTPDPLSHWALIASTATDTFSR